jgi:hypothetical protein
MFRKLDLFPSSGEGRDAYSVGFLRGRTKPENPVILSAIHHRQNPLGSASESNTLTREGGGVTKLKKSAQ